jgi:signal transduction histidine kinase
MRPGVRGSDPGVDGVLDVLSRPDDADLAELVQLAAEICGSEAAGITVQRGGEYHVPVTHGIHPLVCSADDTFCRHTMSTEGVFHVEDALTDSRFSGIGFVTGALASARFYASAPIYSPGGDMVGRLCVIDPEPKKLSALQERTLEALALSVTQLIELRVLQSERRPARSPDSQATATVVAQLAAELSHDLRVPLSSVIASVEMLTDNLSDHPDRTVDALLGRAMRAARRMLRMLDQQMEPRAVVEPSTAGPVDLRQLAEQLVLDSAAVLESAGAAVEIGYLPVVRADPDGMYSVLQNLVTNSVKFARPDVPPEVLISARRVHDNWRISVRDNGIGIPEDHRTEVFSLFSRVERGVAGHGIGLATVARIVAAHGGHVGVEPVEGPGVEIWFELPDDEPDGQ